jgi:hypothetical protein
MRDRSRAHPLFERMFCGHAARRCQINTLDIEHTQWKRYAIGRFANTK